MEKDSKKYKITQGVLAVGMVFSLGTLTILSKEKYNDNYNFQILPKMEVPVYDTYDIHNNGMDAMVVVHVEGADKPLVWLSNPVNDNYLNKLIELYNHFGDIQDLELDKVVLAVDGWDTEDYGVSFNIDDKGQISIKLKRNMHATWEYVTYNEKNYSKNKDDISPYKPIDSSETDSMSIIDTVAYQEGLVMPEEIQMVKTR